MTSASPRWSSSPATAPAGSSTTLRARNTNGTTRHGRRPAQTRTTRSRRSRKTASIAKPTKNMWMPLQGVIHMPSPSGRSRRNMSPRPRPTELRGTRSRPASTRPLRGCTRRRGGAAIAKPLPYRDMPEFDSDGVRLHYVLAGPDDGEPIVLVHGYCSDYELNWVGSRWQETLAGAGHLFVGLDCR